MQTEFTADQDQFREVVARFLEDKSKPAAVRQLMESEAGFDRAVWQQLCGEVGLAGTHIPEEYGGYGFGPVELGIVCEEMGRYLYCGPFFASSVMATYALLICADDKHRHALLPDIASGSVIATLVLDSLDSPELAGKALSVRNGALTGVASLVVDAQVADQLVVIADEDGDSGLFAVNPGDQGVQVTPVTALDPTRKLSRVAFDAAQAIRIGSVDTNAMSRLWDHICMALAHEMIGGAQRLFETTIDYTKMRYQFGRPIGSFQGLKHRCADLLMELEFARAVTHHAARCLAAGEGEAYAASMAKAMASDTYMLTAKEAIQMRGGIGFTWEEDTHLWYKRAKSSEVFMGKPAMHRERMMQMLEAEAEVAA